MPKHIYIFETRHVNYLKPYLDKAKSLGFNVTLTNNSHLENNLLFKEFLSVYKHYSVNPPEFEIACFARYFAIASLVKNDQPFIMTDTDVFLTDAFRDFQGYDFKGSFVGSEGFDGMGSQGQISPHCTVWNRSLLMDFIHFTLDTYKRNYEDDFLEKYYQAQTAKYTYTAVSDMNLIYLWLNQNKVPYINSNSGKFVFGIDHNISSLLCEDGEFKSYANRKYLKIRGNTYSCFLNTGQEQVMALLHFQGQYKTILKDFYAGKYAKFLFFTLKSNHRANRNLRKSKNIAEANLVKQ